MSDKEFIRSQSKLFRDRLEIHPDDADHAAQQFLNHVPFHSGSKISLYFSIKKELDTFPLAEALWAQGITCLLPIIQDHDQSLAFARWDKLTPLKKGDFGIPVPEFPQCDTPDILVVPLLAFDQTGMRLGYGKGHYDRALSQLRSQNPSVLAVGYAYSQQACLFALPSEPHDQRMNFVVTPERVFDFSIR